MRRLETTMEFPDEDYKFLKREAAKRHVTVDELMKEILREYAPNGFRFDLPRRMSEDEFKDHLNGLVLAVLKKARMAIQ